ncbi:MAG TPA: hypothetical protein VKT27_12055 [Candidatus Binataceae bacterium]|nr:hypothetical protein [Candidatus Binataceae bacterium]
MSKLVNSAAANRVSRGGTLTFALSNSGSSVDFSIEHWINLQAIQLLVHHASSVVAAIVIFALVARLAIWLLPHGLVRKIVVVIDDVVLIGLLLYFGYEMFVYLWNRKPPLEHTSAAAFGRVVARAGLLPSPTSRLARIARLLLRLPGTGVQ